MKRAVRNLIFEKIFLLREKKKLITRYKKTLHVSYAKYMSKTHIQKHILWDISRINISIKDGISVDDSMETITAYLSKKSELARLRGFLDMERRRLSKFKEFIFKKKERDLFNLRYKIRQVNLKIKNFKINLKKNRLKLLKHDINYLKNLKIKLKFFLNWRWVVISHMNLRNFQIGTRCFIQNEKIIKALKKVTRINLLKYWTLKKTHMDYKLTIAFRSLAYKLSKDSLTKRRKNLGLEKKRVLLRKKEKLSVSDLNIALKNNFYGWKNMLIAREEIWRWERCMLCLDEKKKIFDNDSLFDSVKKKFDKVLKKRKNNLFIGAKYR